MARSSRGRGRRSSAKKQVDWVVNDGTYGVSYQVDNNQIVYMPLVVPEFLKTFLDPTGVDPRGAYMWPEQDTGIQVMAVKGFLEAVPETWAVGSIYRFSWRLIVRPTEYALGYVAIEDPNYDLTLPQYANERFLSEGKVTGLYSMGGQLEMQRITWKGFRQLEKDEGLYLAVQNHSGITQRINLRPYFRTLTRAEA